MLCAACAMFACAAPTQPDSLVAGARADADAATRAPDECRAAPDAGRPQYVVGYGSLMQDESRQRTAPHAGPVHPVEVSGYRRAWIARGDPVGFSTTFLGVTKDAASHLNAVVYQVDADDLRATDQRESSYCRMAVPASAVASLEKMPFEMGAGQAWIYANPPSTIATPSVEFPIVQSYVDIFVSGCLEQEQKFGVEGFARECLATTHEWSGHWVNDRLYPRRPFIYQPMARQIDQLLSLQVPAFFAQVKLQ
jgi:hypothetical protein